MKGVELPINALIIIVIAIIVLVAIIAMFYTGIKSPQNTLSAQAALDRACLKLHSYDCKEGPINIIIDDFDADNDGQLDPGSVIFMNGCGKPANPEKDNLMSLCLCYFQVSWISDVQMGRDCKQLCNC